MRAWHWMGLVVALGCGPSVGDGEDDGGGSATQGSSGATESDSIGSTSAADTAATSDATTTPETTTVGTSGATTTGVDTTGMDESDSDSGTGSGACPDPEGVAVAFTVSPDENVDSDCTVTAVAPSIELDCGGDTVTITWSVSPGNYSPYLYVDDTVHLQYVVDQIFWENRWLALHSVGGLGDWLLVGAVSSSVLDPPGMTLNAMFDAPSSAPTVSVEPGACPLIDDDCGSYDRAVINFIFFEDMLTQVYDQGTGFVDFLAFGYDLTVDTAEERTEPIACDDLPAAWYQLSLVYFPSD